MCYQMNFQTLLAANVSSVTQSNHNLWQSAQVITSNPPLLLPTPVQSTQYK